MEITRSPSLIWRTLAATPYVQRFLRTTNPTRCRLASVFTVKRSTSVVATWFPKKNNLLIIFLYRTLNEYADIHEKITGQKVNRIYVPHEQVLKRWNSGKEGPFYVLRIAADSLAQNFVGRDHNELLNPGQKYFKPKTWEEIVGA